jgi:hypothetical protein
VAQGGTCVLAADAPPAPDDLAPDDAEVGSGDEVAPGDAEIAPGDAEVMPDATEAGGEIEAEGASGLPPGGWTCPVSWYGDAAACDCGCGAPDPDCADMELPVHGCPSGACEADGACAACVPTCSGGDPGAPPKECGSDGCGGSCGTCFDPLEPVCVEGKCVPCVPACGALGLACGPDGCGGSCGSCAEGSQCIQGLCGQPPPLASCKAYCGGLAPAGCSCAADCTGLGTCCADFSDVCGCLPSCFDKECGPDGCGGECGTCDPGTACVAGQCEVPLCGPEPCSGHGVCNPADGSCQCSAGYLGAECDACAAGFLAYPDCYADLCADQKCGVHAVCAQSEPGAFACVCDTGYSGVGVDGCDPIDNCAEGAADCHELAGCTPTGPGTHTCDCKPGYEGDGVADCQPIDTCAKGLGGCDPSAVCTATGHGTNTCTCPFGTEGDGSTCGPMAFDPRDVPGLALWVRADAGLVLDGGAPPRVEAWVDQSGSGNDFKQAVPDRRPDAVGDAFSGRPALRFSASGSQTMTVGTPFPAPATVCVVARLVGPTFGRVLASLYGNWFLGWHGDGMQDHAFFEGWALNPSVKVPAPTDVPLIYCAVLSGSSSSIYRGLRFLGSSSGGLAGPHGLSLASWGGVTEYADSEVAEVLVFSTALEDATRAKLQAYLVGRYPTCKDGIRNRSESDADCGGGTCAACPDAKGCGLDADCASGICDEPMATCGEGQRRVFDFTGAVETFTLPVDRTVRLLAWGAGGGGSGGSCAHGGGGGYGAGYLAGQGQAIEVRVGEGPPNWVAAAGPYFGGGGKSAPCGPSGGGGGRSQVALAGGGSVLLVAGGGGGAGPGAGGHGGAGGGGTGDAGYAPWIGEDGSDTGAGGGGGWYGGKKGTGPGCDKGGGGGGGSSHTGVEVVAGETIPAEGATPGRALRVDRGGAGEGALVCSGAGTHGRVVVDWSLATSCGQDSGGCPAHTACAESAQGVVRCECPAGYYDTGAECHLADACAAGLGGCDPNASCTATGEGTNLCSCNPGYDGPGATCSPMPFDPRSLDDLALWVRGETGIVTEGGAVAEWRDQSGNGNDFVQADPAKRPAVVAAGAGAEPALGFSAGQAQNLAVPVSFAPPVTVCVVARMLGPVKGRILTSLANNWLLGWWGGGEDKAYFEGWVSGPPTPASSDVLLYCSVQTGALSSVYRFQTLLASNANGLAGPNGLALGAGLGGSEPSDAEVFEVLVYGRALGDAERERVVAYLSGKHGLCVDGTQGCADADHDGSADSADCAPADPTVHPYALESCDGMDNDCDGATDGAAACGDCAGKSTKLPGEASGQTALLSCAEWGPESPIAVKSATYAASCGAPTSLATVPAACDG